MAAACALLCLAGCGPRASAPDLPHTPGSLSERFYAPRGWTWGTVKLGDGSALRYGVASPPVTPRGDILILPDRDEPSEVWFETANDLNDQGYTVWTLEGSGRGAGALDPSQGALSTMIDSVIRPRAALVVVAQGLGATEALRALQAAKLTGVDGLVLASPTLEPATLDLAMPADRVETLAEELSRARMGWIPLPGDGQPRFGQAPPTGLDPRRASLAAAWRRSDPALRPRATTFGWVWGYDQQVRLARASETVPKTSPRSIMAATASDVRAGQACKALAGCTPWAVPSPAPHLARDEVRRQWLAKILALADSGRGAIGGQRAALTQPGGLSSAGAAPAGTSINHGIP